MKHFLIIAIIFVTPLLGFAGSKDLDLLNAMTMAGASQIIVGNKAIAKMTNVTCSLRKDQGSCTLETAIEADVDESTTINETLWIGGSTAVALIDAVVAMGAKSYEVRNGIAIRLKEVTCTQPFRPREFPGERETTCTLRSY